MIEIHFELKQVTIEYIRPWDSWSLIFHTYL